MAAVRTFQLRPERWPRSRSKWPPRMAQPRHTGFTLNDYRQRMPFCPTSASALGNSRRNLDPMYWNISVSIINSLFCDFFVTAIWHVLFCITHVSVIQFFEWVENYCAIIYCRPSVKEWIQYRSRRRPAAAQCVQCNCCCRPAACFHEMFPVNI